MICAKLLSTALLNRFLGILHIFNIMGHVLFFSIKVLKQNIKGRESILPEITYKENNTVMHNIFMRKTAIIMCCVVNVISDDLNLNIIGRSSR